MNNKKPLTSQAYTDNWISSRCQIESHAEKCMAFSLFSYNADTTNTLAFILTGINRQ